MGNGRGEPFEGRRTRFFGVSEGGGGKSVATGDTYQGNEARELRVVGGNSRGWGARTRVKISKDYLHPSTTRGVLLRRLQTYKIRQEQGKVCAGGRCYARANVLRENIYY